MKFSPSLFGNIAIVSALFWHGIPTKAIAAYFQTNLASNNPAYNPQILDPYVQGARGIAIRTFVAGGHFWINNLDTGTVTEYVGDVGNVPLYQDELKVVFLPASPQNSSPLASPTGQVFNTSKDFVITLNHPNGAITAPSKFLFTSLDGTISAWTDRTPPNSIPDSPTEATLVVDRFGQAVYQGITVSNLPANNRIYAADFDTTPGIDVFDSTFTNITTKVPFTNPFAAEGFAAYNIQTFGSSLYVTYAKPAPTAVGDAEAGSGLGKLAQFDFDGSLLSIWDDQSLLNVPAGLAIAPADFGEFSNALLIANFGDGTIVGFDRTTRQALGYLQDTQGKPIDIPGLWGILFGNGLSLGKTDALYFTAAPNGGSKDGLFGKVEAVPEPSSLLGIVIAGGLTVGYWRRKAKC